jgi:peptidyl-prolyl cis-trans isomerase C
LIPATFRAFFVRLDAPSAVRRNRIPEPRVRVSSKHEPSFKEHSLMRRFLLLGLCALAAACGQQGPKKTGVPVARGNGITITTDEFKARIDEQSPFIRARYTTLERKKEFLDNLIRQEVLAAEAERQGLDKDPEVRNTLRKIMVQKLVQKRFQPDGNAADVPEADLQKYYEDHKGEYVRARKVRVHAVVWNVQSPADRAKKVGAAKKVLAKIKAEEKKNPLVFAQAVAESSEDAASKQLAGDLQFRSQEELEKAYSKPLADAAFALKQGETSGVVEAPNGVYLVKFTGEQPELNRTFDQVKTQIAAKLSRDKKTKEFDEWLKGLRENARIAVDEKALESVEVAAAQAPGMAGGPMCGPMGGGHGGGIQVVPAAPAAPVQPAPAAAQAPRK